MEDFDEDGLLPMTQLRLLTVSRKERRRNGTRELRETMDAMQVQRRVRVLAWLLWAWRCALMPLDDRRSDTQDRKRREAARWN